YTGEKDGNGTALTESVYGVSVTSTAFQDILSLAVGGALAGGQGVAGSATVEVLSETSKAHIDQGALVNNPETPAKPVGSFQGVNVHATNVTRAITTAGAVAGGVSGGIGAG